MRRTTDVYFASDGSIREMLRVILLSEEMYSEPAYRSRIKSPVELVIGTERALEVVTDGRPELRHTRMRSRRGDDIPALLERYGVTGSADEVVDWTCDLLVGGDVDAETPQRARRPPRRKLPLRL